MKVHFVVWNIKKAQEPKPPKPEDVNNTPEEIKPKKLDLIIEELKKLVDKKTNVILVLVECSKDNAETISTALGEGFKVSAKKGHEGAIQVISKLINELSIEPIKSSNIVDLNELERLMNKTWSKLPERNLIKAMLDYLMETEGNMKNFYAFCADKYLIDKELNQKHCLLELWKGDTPLMLIGGIHFWSKTDVSRAKERNQDLIMRILAKEAYLSDKFKGKLALMGDFNMNPYEELMYLNDFKDANAHLSANHLFTLNDRAVFDLDEKYDRAFYNPCWNLLGDFHNKPNYTFKEIKASYEKVRNLFDGVIMRKDLISPFDDKSLKIIDSGDISDHFPVIFAFDFSE